MKPMLSPIKPLNKLSSLPIKGLDILPKLEILTTKVKELEQTNKKLKT